MGVFRDQMLLHPSYDVLIAMNRVILDQIKMERDGDIIDRGAIRACVSMLADLYEGEKEVSQDRLYVTRFEGMLYFGLRGKHCTNVLI